MRKICFAWLPTYTIDGWIWFKWFKHYASPGRVLNIPFVLQDQYDAGVRREHEGEIVVQ